VHEQSEADRMAYKMYINDYDGVYRRRLRRHGSPALPEISYVDYLEPYLKNNDLFCCPKTTRTPQHGGPSIDPDDPPQPSLHLQVPVCREWQPQWQPDVCVDSPPECVLAYDSLQNETASSATTMGAFGFYEGHYRRAEVTRRATATCGKRHAEGFNVIYTDGHTRNEQDLEPSTGC